MKISAEKILMALAALIICAGIGMVISLQRKDAARKTCKGISVEIAQDWHFVSAEDIKDYIRGYYGPCTGMRNDSISLGRIENLLDSESMVLKSEVWLTPDDSLHVKISQRKPVARFQKDSLGFYVDGSGCMFPLQRRYSAQVPVIDGHIPMKINAKGGYPTSEKERKWVEDILSMLSYMEESKIWSENIVQISVDRKGDLLMVPRQGKEIFIFGDPGRAAEKFGKMEKYYTHIAPGKEKGYYSTVNVKYRNQIICRK